jgi:hypothetical protein
VLILNDFFNLIHALIQGAVDQLQKTAETRADPLKNTPFGSVDQ